MIKEIINNPNNRYGRFFLSLEADDGTDASEDTIVDDGKDVIKFNTKIISVKNTKPRTKLYTAGEDEMNNYLNSPDSVDDNLYNGETGEELPSEDNTELDADIPDTTDIGSDDNGDVSMDTNQDMTTDANTDVNPEVNTDGSVDTSVDDSTNPTVTIDGNEVTANPTPDQADPDAPMTDPLVQSIDDTNTEINGDQANMDVSTGDAGDVNAEINTDAPMTDDLNMDAGMDPNAASMTDDGSMGDPNAAGQAKRGPGIEYDSTRKYILFKKYINLCDAIKDYSEKLNRLTNDDYNTNQIYKVAINKLQEIYDVTYDFVIMKFELSSYIQSLLFYQERISNIYRIFDFVKSSVDTVNKKYKNKAK